MWIRFGRIALGVFGVEMAEAGLCGLGLVIDHHGIGGARRRRLESAAALPDNPQPRFVAIYYDR